MKIRKQKLRDKYKAAGKEKPAVSKYAAKIAAEHRKDVVNLRGVEFANSQPEMPLCTNK